MCPTPKRNLVTPHIHRHGDRHLRGDPGYETRVFHRGRADDHAGAAERPELATSVGRALAAIHQLPTSFVSDAGLPSLTPFEVLRSAVCVMDRAVVESGAMVAAGAVVTPRKRVKAGELWAGTPARFARALRPEEQEYMRWVTAHYRDLAEEYRARG